MKILSLLCLSLLSASTLADVCSNARWVQENCPQCRPTPDGKFLLPFQGQFVKFDVNAYGEDLNSLRVDLLWQGLSNERGEVVARELTMNSEGDRERASAAYRELCSYFKEYGYHSSGFVFSQGDHFSGPGEATRGRINQTCSQDKPNWMIRGLDFITLGAFTPDTCTETRINTDARELMKTPVILRGNVRERSEGSRR